MSLLGGLLLTLVTTSCSLASGDVIPKCTHTVMTELSEPYVEIKTPDNMEIMYLSRFCFSVTMCQGAHIVLSPRPKPLYQQLNQNDTYCITIGSASNTKTFIRVRGKQVAVKHHRPLDCSQSRRFYVSWAKGIVEVGSEEPDPTKPETLVDKPFLSYQDDSPLLISHAYVGSKESKGEWSIHLPCPKMSVTNIVATTTVRKNIVSQKFGPHQVRCVETAENDTSYTQVIQPSNVVMKRVHRFCFYVKICKDARIILSSTATRNETYEVRIGTDNNTYTELYKNGESKASTQHHTPPLDGSKYRKFYVSWKEGKIEVGTEGHSSGVLVTYDDPIPIFVAYIFVSGQGRAGTFLIDFSDSTYILSALEVTTERRTTIKTLQREVQHTLTCGECSLAKSQGRWFCYIISDQSLTFENAETFCESGGGHLAVLDMTENRDLIMELLHEQGGDNDLWVRAGKVSVRGSQPLVILKWDAPPSNSDYCTSVCKRHDGQGANWKTVPCNSTHRALCQIPIKMD